MKDLLWVAKVFDRVRLLPFLVLGSTMACTETGSDLIEPGVSSGLAEARSASLSDIRYALRFEIPPERDTPIAGTESIRFRKRGGQPLVLDFKGPADAIRSVRVGGVAADFTVTNEHIVLPERLFGSGVNDVSIEFVAGDAPLNRQDEYLYSLFVPDRASIVFPCFDQPDLKARFSLELDLPAEWLAVSNGGEEEIGVEDGRRTFRFRETEPISTYLFAFAAGKFAIESREIEGRFLRMFHRETDNRKVKRNVDRIFRLHADALDWLIDYTSIDYPFGKFDFVLIPSFPFGGMEHPGAIFYKSESLLLEESATQNDLLGRASLIAHETAHMWFGDLVTMRWFSDVWMKEVFANFMAAKVVNPSFPHINHELRFLLAHYPAAYEVDRTGGTHPIRQQLDNLSDAASLYGAIIYEKAPIVMRQLEELTGEEEFRQGMREYLRDFQFGNASWHDLVSILDRRCDEDIASWSGIWVEGSGRPAISVEVDFAAGRRISSLRVEQVDPAGEGRLWPQPLQLLLVTGQSGSRIPVRLAHARAEIAGAEIPAFPDYVLPNGGGRGYGLFRLDEASRHFLLSNLASVPDDLVRATAWLDLWDGMLEGDLQPESLVRTGLAVLQAEENGLVAEQIIADVNAVYWRVLSTQRREAISKLLESLYWDRTLSASDKTLKATFFRAFQSAGISVDACDRLRKIWEERLVIPGLELGEADFMTLALQLAVRGVPDAGNLLEQQLKRIENAERRERFAFLIPAFSADLAVRRQFQYDLLEPSNRRHEPWVLEALAYLHHPLRASESAEWVPDCLNVLPELRRTGTIFFPKRWLDTVLSGHATPEVLGMVDDYLEQHPELPPRLKGIILQSSDFLRRAVLFRSVGEDGSI